MAEKAKPEAPWKELYKDFYVLEIPHGCLVKVGESVMFVQGATAASIKADME